MNASEAALVVIIAFGTTKRGNEHVITLPDWFIEKEGL